MFKINLLPKEVLERRRYEDWYPRVFLIAAVALAVVVAFYAFFWIKAKSMDDELQSIKEQSKLYESSAEKLSIFQNKETQLQQRETVALGALAGRVNVGEVANDVSLVLPDEVWLESLTINQDTGLVISANTPRTAGQSTDVAYKSVAKTLVRLSELPELFDVWLSSAANAQWSKWVAKAGTETSITRPVNVVTFDASGKVLRAAAGTSSGSSASGVSINGAGGSTTPSAAAHGAVNAANSANTGSTQ
jgi:Tfp pilus assembly protein PilN